MHVNACRFLQKSLFTLGLIAVVFSFNNCKKEGSPATPPVIGFVSDSGYLSSDTILIVGDRVQVGINATASSGNITFFQISMDNGTRSILLDSGLNKPSLHYSINIIKSSSSFERWTFLVMDRDRNKDSIQINLGKSDSSHYGKIVTYNDIYLGAQENMDYGSFLYLSNGTVVNLHDAFQNQSLVDIIYYYGQYEGTLSSPNEAEAPTIFAGVDGIANWTIKNETRYDTTTLVMDDFDRASNDSLLLAVYEPTAGKRKAKYVIPGMVISFKSSAGKIGLMKIDELLPGTTGRMRCSVKVQE